MARKPRPADFSRRRKREKRPVTGRCPINGKLSFSTKAKARKELTRYFAAGHSARAVYLCSCGSWHLTSQRRAA